MVITQIESIENAISDTLKTTGKGVDNVNIEEVSEFLNDLLRVAPVEVTNIEETDQHIRINYTQGTSEAKSIIIDSEDNVTPLSIDGQFIERAIIQFLLAKWYHFEQINNPYKSETIPSSLTALTDEEVSNLFKDIIDGNVYIEEITRDGEIIDDTYNNVNSERLDSSNISHFKFRSKDAQDLGEITVYFRVNEQDKLHKLTMDNQGLNIISVLELDTDKFDLKDDWNKKVSQFLVAKGLDHRYTFNKYLSN